MSNFKSITGDVFVKWTPPAEKTAAEVREARRKAYKESGADDLLWDIVSSERLGQDVSAKEEEWRSIQESVREANPYPVLEPQTKPVIKPEVMPETPAEGTEEQPEVIPEAIPESTPEEQNEEGSDYV